MSALGQKQTSRATSVYVRYWGLSGLSDAPLRMSAYSHKRAHSIIANVVDYQVRKGIELNARHLRIDSGLDCALAAIE